MNLKMVRAFKAKVNDLNARPFYKDAPLELETVMFQDGQWAVVISSSKFLPSFALEELFYLHQLYGLLGFISSDNDVLSYHFQ